MSLEAWGRTPVSFIYWTVPQFIAWERIRVWRLRSRSMGRWEVLTEGGPLGPGADPHPCRPRQASRSQGERGSGVGVRANLRGGAGRRKEEGRGPPNDMAAVGPRAPQRACAEPGAHGSPAARWAWGRGADCVPPRPCAKRRSLTSASAAATTAAAGPGEAGVGRKEGGAGGGGGRGAIARGQKGLRGLGGRRSQSRSVHSHRRRAGPALFARPGRRPTGRTRPRQPPPPPSPGPKEGDAPGAPPPRCVTSSPRGRGGGGDEGCGAGGGGGTAVSVSRPPPSGRPAETEARQTAHAGAGRLWPGARKGKDSREQVKTHFPWA